MARSVPCVSCRTLSGELQPPGGIIYDHAHWVLFLRSRPLLTPGQGFIVLKRHCEDIATLTMEEAATLGEVMRRAAATYMQVLAPERVHFGLDAEETRHVHLHVLPRYALFQPVISQLRFSAPVTPCSRASTFVVPSAMTRWHRLQKCCKQVFAA